jgi:2-dehydro-3-deoxyphosphogluconate aldolase/(4S)-4-hydroxy-2-oxoglutarate aldolase
MRAVANQFTICWDATTIDRKAQASKMSTTNRDIAPDQSERLVEALARHRVLAIVRAGEPAAALAAVLALARAGIAAIEVSLTTPDAPAVLARARAQLGDDVLLGAGTVISRRDAELAVEAGASFLVTPGLSPGAAAAADLGVGLLAGALTPTELIQARELAPDAVKLFPAGHGGPGYLRALRDPFPGVPLVPVGGVGAANAAQYLDAGAIAVGVGGSLVGDAARPGGDLGALRDRARALLAAVAAHTG